jgi:hypothetical protein
VLIALFSVSEATRWHGGCTNALRSSKDGPTGLLRRTRSSSKVLETNESDSRLRGLDVARE